MCWQLCMVGIHPFAQLHALGTSKEAYTLQANSWWYLWLGTFESSSHQDGIYPCLTHHSIQSMACKGRVPDLWALMVLGVRLTSAGVAVCLLPWHLLGRAPHHPGVPGGGASVVEDTRFASPHLGWSQPLPSVLTNWPLHVVPPQPATLVGATGRLDLPWCCILGSPLVARLLSFQQRSPDVYALWCWVTRSILEWCPLCEGTWDICWCWKNLMAIFPPQWEFTWGLSNLASGSPWCEVAWEPSPCCSKDLDLLWVEENQWLKQHQWPVEHWWIVEQLILSICSSRIIAPARAQWWVSLVRAIISSYVPWFRATNSLYILQFMAAKAIWGSGQVVSAGNCVSSLSGCVGGCLSLRQPFIDFRTHLQSCSSVASSHLPHPGSYVGDRPPGTSHQSPGTGSRDEWLPWWWALLWGPSLLMVPFGPGRWCTHTPFGPSLWHAGTSAAAEIHDGGCCEFTTVVHIGRHWHLTASPLLILICLVHSPASWQQQFSWFYSHIAGCLSHDNWNNNNNRHHRHCHYIPIHLNIDLQCKPLNYAVSTKYGKATHFLSTFYTTTYKGMQPNWSCQTLALSLLMFHHFRGI